MKPILVSSLLAIGSLTVSAQLSPTRSFENSPGDASPDQRMAAHPALSANYGKLPLSFEANQGQSDPQVKFLSRGQGYSLFLTDKAAVLALTKSGGKKQPLPCTNNLLNKLNLSSRPDPEQSRRGSGGTCDSSDAGCPIQADSCSVGLSGKAQPSAAHPSKMDVVRMELAGSRSGVKVEGIDQLPGTANYFIGNDPAKWHSNVPTYAKVKYSGVYPGVDLVYYGNQRQLEYDFVVAPGTDPKQVRLHFTGAKKLKLDSDGDLMVIAKDGEVAFHKPAVYQEIDGEQRQVESRFRVRARNAVDFSVGSYDHTRELVIDPVLVYSTYLGGSQEDFAYGVAVDTAGSAYVTGQTSSEDFPLAHPFEQYSTQKNGNSYAFISKFAVDGSALVYSSYIGGTGGDVALAIAVDSADSAYLAGYTSSSDFPILNPLQSVSHTAVPIGLPFGGLDKPPWHPIYRVARETIARKTNFGRETSCVRRPSRSPASCSPAAR